jgi:hypothetical protein
MKNNLCRLLIQPLGFLLSTALCFSVSAQKAKPKTSPQAKAGPIILGVIYDGTSVEPIAFVDKGKLVTPEDGTGNEAGTLSKLYYKTGSKYSLIFGGVPNGTVTVSKSNMGTECGGSSAEVSIQSTKTKLKGFVMGLATNIAPKAKGSGVRRLPTAAERSDVEALIRAEYAKHKVPAAAYKQLHSHNLTAVDVNGDGTAELVGSYWASPKTTERGLLFFIAEKNATGKYAFEYSEWDNYTADKVMSGELKDLEEGIYQTLLLDVFDYNGDGTAEIFTLAKAFEGNNYSVFNALTGNGQRSLRLTTIAAVIKRYFCDPPSARC